MNNKKSSRYDVDDALQTYFDQIKVIPLLTFEEELELSRKIQAGDEAAKRRLIEANLRLVAKIAHVYMASDISYMDIIQEGNIGLMKAAEKYHFERNVRFSTYANWWIRQSISRFLSNKRRVIRLPHRKEESLGKIRKAFNVMSQTLQREPTTQEVADYVNIDVGELEYLINITDGLVSLEADVGPDENATVIDLHEDYTYNPEVEMLKKSTRGATLKFLDKLQDTERQIIISRFQLDGSDKQTLQSIGDSMGVSTETVRQIEKRAIEKMRENAEEIRECIYVDEAM
jgi:RNA polymerase primary sigma factor